MKDYTEEIEDLVKIETKKGYLVEGCIIRFADSFEDWLGLPFCERVVASDDLFSLELVVPIDANDNG